MTHKYFDFTFEYEGDSYYSSTTHNGTVYANDYTLTLTGSNITVGQSLSLSGTFSGGSDYDIKIYQDNTLIDTVTTGTNGAFSKTVTGLSAGSYTFKAVFESEITSYVLNSSNLNITVSKPTPTLSCEIIYGSTVTYGSSTLIGGVLSYNYNPIESVPIKIYQDNTLIDTVTSHYDMMEEINYGKVVTGLNAGTYTFKAVYDGDSTYGSVTSNNVTVTVTKATPTISLSTSTSSISYGETATVTGTLSLGSGKSVKIYDGSTLLDTVTTGSNGAFSYSNSNLSVGSHTLKATYDGDNNYNTINSNNIIVTIQPSMILEITGSSFTPHTNCSGLTGSNMVIDWGDGTSESITSGQKLPSHTYSSNGNYRIKITGEITNIGANCFRGCSNLTSVNIPNSVTSIGISCFYNCSGLTSVNIPNSVTSIGASCFYNCSNLTSVNIPNSVTNLNSGCFKRCSSFTSVDIPNSVTSIGDSCFEDCSNLTSVNIPNSVTSIGYGSFGACSSLTSINIPNSITSIGVVCFASCTSLTSINIPNSVTSIGASCFVSCGNLINYQLYWTTPPITYNSNMMPNNTNTYFTIPYGTTTNYVAKSFPSAKLIERD